MRLVEHHRGNRVIGTPIARTTDGWRALSLRAYVVSARGLPFDGRASPIALWGPGAEPRDSYVTIPLEGEYVSFRGERPVVVRPGDALVERTLTWEERWEREMRALVIQWSSAHGQPRPGPLRLSASDLAHARALAERICAPCDEDPWPLLEAEGRLPEGWDRSAKKRAHKDIDARWAKKDQQVSCGYKDHVKTDAASKLIESAAVTAASVHDSQAMDELVAPGDEVVFADSAYAGAPLGRQMDAKGVVRCAVEPARRGAPLTAQEKESNQRIARVRARVEHVFALMSGQAGRIFQRHIGHARNAASIVLMNWIYNLQRYEQICRLNIQIA